MRDPRRDSAPDLVHRDFARAEPNRLWVCELDNPRRRHSSLGMLSPIDYEQQHQQEAIAA